MQPGVRNLAISEAAAEHGLFYAPDPSSQIACTIGGNVAENAGGLHCLKYGLTIHNVLCARIVTAEGDLLDIDEQMPGYNVLSALVGSEGLLGIVVEVTVKLLPRPQTTRLLLAAFDGLEDAARRSGQSSPKASFPLPLNSWTIFPFAPPKTLPTAAIRLPPPRFCFASWTAEAADVEEQVAVTRHLLNRHRTTEIRVAADEAERLLLWKGRKAAFPRNGSPASRFVLH